MMNASEDIGMNNESLLNDVNLNFNYNHMTKENPLLDTIESINFWQDEGLFLSLDKKLLQNNDSEYSKLQSELSQLQEELDRLNGISDSLQNDIESEKSKKARYENTTQELIEENSKLVLENNKVVKELNELEKILTSFSSPDEITKFILENYSNEDLKILNDSLDEYVKRYKQNFRVAPNFLNYSDLNLNSNNNYINSNMNNGDIQNNFNNLMYMYMMNMNMNMNVNIGQLNVKNANDSNNMNDCQNYDMNNHQYQYNN